VAALGAVGLLRRRKVVLGLGIVWWAAYVFHDVQPNVAAGLFAHQQAITRFGLLFLSGTLLFLYRDVVPCSNLLAGVAAVEIFTVYWLRENPYVWTAPLLAYLCLWVSIKLPMPHAIRHNDFSYGLYIFAMPLQQLLTIYGLARWNLAVFTVVSLLGGLLLAAASWFGLERHALKLKNFRAKPRLAAGHRAGGQARPVTVAAQRRPAGVGRHRALR
jgi:hypothetical protein